MQIKTSTTGGPDWGSRFSVPRLFPERPPSAAERVSPCRTSSAADAGSDLLLAHRAREISPLLQDFLVVVDAIAPELAEEARRLRAVE
jgi:hypothetical protein